MASGMVQRVDSGRMSSVFEQSVQSNGLDDHFLLGDEQLTLQHVSSMQPADAEEAESVRRTPAEASSSSTQTSNRSPGDLMTTLHDPEDSWLVASPGGAASTAVSRRAAPATPGSSYGGFDMSPTKAQEADLAFAPGDKFVVGSGPGASGASPGKHSLPISARNSSKLLKHPRLGPSPSASSQELASLPEATTGYERTNGHSHDSAAVPLAASGAAFGSIQPAPDRRRSAELDVMRNAYLQQQEQHAGSANASGTATQAQGRPGQDAAGRPAGASTATGAAGNAQSPGRDSAASALTAAAASAARAGTKDSAAKYSSLSGAAKKAKTARQNLGLHTPRNTSASQAGSAAGSPAGSEAQGSTQSSSSPAPAASAASAAAGYQSPFQRAAQSGNLPRFSIESERATSYAGPASMAQTTSYGTPAQVAPTRPPQLNPPSAFSQYYQATGAQAPVTPPVTPPGSPFGMGGRPPLAAVFSQHQGRVPGELQRVSPASSLMRQPMPPKPLSAAQVPGIRQSLSRLATPDQPLELPEPVAPHKLSRLRTPPQPLMDFDAAFSASGPASASASAAQHSGAQQPGSRGSRIPKPSASWVSPAKLQSTPRAGDGHAEGTGESTFSGNQAADDQRAGQYPAQSPRAAAPAYPQGSPMQSPSKIDPVVIDSMRTAPRSCSRIPLPPGAADARDVASEDVVVSVPTTDADTSVPGQRPSGTSIQRPSTLSRRQAGKPGPDLPSTGKPGSAFSPARISADGGNTRFRIGAEQAANSHRDSPRSTSSFRSAAGVVGVADDESSLCNGITAAAADRLAEAKGAVAGEGVNPAGSETAFGEVEVALTQQAEHVKQTTAQPAVTAAASAAQAGSIAAGGKADGKPQAAKSSCACCVVM